jgi:hypothetical protein
MFSYSIGMYRFYMSQVHSEFLAIDPEQGEQLQGGEVEFRGQMAKGSMVKDFH